MTAIRVMSLCTDEYILRVVDTGGNGFTILNNAYQVWLTNNPDAAPEDLETDLVDFLGNVRNRSDVDFYVHVYTLPEWPDLPQIAMLAVKEGVSIPAEWWE